MTDRVARMWTAGRCGWAGPGRGDGCDGGRDADGWMGGRVEGEVGGGVWAGGWPCCAAGRGGDTLARRGGLRRGEAGQLRGAEPRLRVRRSPACPPRRAALGAGALSLGAQAPSG